MCGLAGIVAWTERYRVSRDILQRMSATIAHRGPDGQGLFLNHEGEITAQRPQAAMVHRRLAVLDLDPRANQPFVDDGGRWIVFNGEIYNFRDLRRELSRLRPDYAWRTQGDTEVLLLAYAVWGPQCVEHLNGMFALAIWDESAGAMFLARDRMGQKPLYLATAPADDNRGLGAIAFASEKSALHCLPWVKRQLDSGSLVQYLRWGYLISDQLPPAHRLLISNPGQGAVPESYYRHSPPGPLGMSKAESIGALVEQTRRLVRQAVARQLVADVPMGCLLSGGIDSSIIAACMKGAGGGEREVLTFSMGFDDPRYDETEYAAAVAAHLGTKHHRFVVRPDAIEDLPRLAEVFGEPFGDSSALPTHYLARETRRHVKVALSGDGGDELFGGYDRYRALALTQRLDRLPGLLRPAMLGWASRGLARVLRGSHPKSSIARMKRLLATMTSPPSQRYQGYLRLFDDPTIRQLLQDKSPDAMGQPEPDIYNVYLETRDAVESALAFDRDTYLPGDLLTKLDRASMLHALEVRSPFMDHELVSFAARLPTPLLWSGGPKRMLREAFGRDLPEFVFQRPKMGFALPIGQWFRVELRSMLHDHLFAAGSFAARHFVNKTVRRLVEEHEARRVDHSQRLYSLLMLELWFAGQNKHQDDCRDVHKGNRS